MTLRKALHLSVLSFLICKVILVKIFHPLDSKLLKPGTQLPAPLVSLQKGVFFSLYITLCFPNTMHSVIIWMIGFTGSLQFRNRTSHLECLLIASLRLIDLVGKEATLFSFRI